MRKLVVLGLSMLLLWAYGCGGAAPAEQQSTPIATATAEAPTAAAAPTVDPSGSSAWVPPTALAGTPIPGAEATLTAAPALKTATITLVSVVGDRIDMDVEIADTDQSRGLGLMFRSSMPPTSGMLFDFGGDTTGGFWMQNTILPLSIAFISADGTIIDIKDMQPLDTTGVGPSGPYRYALETNQGFFRAYNIDVGDKVILPGATSAAVIPGMPGCAK